MVLLGKGDVVLVQSEESREGAKARTDAFNDWVLDQARGSGEFACLASPVSGGAIAAPAASISCSCSAAARAAGPPMNWRGLPGISSTDRGSGW